MLVTAFSLANASSLSHSSSSAQFTISAGSFFFRTVQVFVFNGHIFRTSAFLAFLVSVSLEDATSSSFW